MKNKEKKKRAPNLTEERIAGILFIIDRWSEGRLTWDALINAIECSTQVVYTRQALASHQLIQEAYVKKNESLAQGPSAKKNIGTVELDDALLIIETQRAEIARLKKAESLFLEQFARWAANAHMQGIDYRRLDSPLDAVDRDSSLVHKRSLKSVA